MRILSATSFVMLALFARQADADVRDVLRAAREAEAAGRLVDAADARLKAVSLLGTPHEKGTQLLLVAELYRRIDRPDLQADTLAEALKALPAYDPRHYPALEQAVSLYIERLDRPGSALEILEPQVEGMVLGRGDIRVWADIGTIHQHMGDTEKAQPVYETLLREQRFWRHPMYKRLKHLLFVCRDELRGKTGFNRNLDTATVVDRYRARLEEKNYTEAIAAIAELLERFHDAAMEREGVAAIGVRESVNELFAEMKPAERAGYARALKVEVERVIGRGRAEEIEKFMYTHPWPAFRPVLLAAAADALAREMRYARAAAYYREVAGTEADRAARRMLLLKAARAAVFAGEPLPGGFNPDETFTIGGRETKGSEAVTAWGIEAGFGKRFPVKQTPLSEMKEDRLRLLQAPLALRKWEAGWQADIGKRKNPGMTPSFVPYVISGDRSQIFINTSEMIYAVDPVGGRLLWARAPSELFTAELAPPALPDLRLLDSPKRFYTAVSAGLVYFRLNWAHRATREMRSAIFAARRSDGVLVWSTEGTRELAGMRFASDPAYRDGIVVAALWEPREVPVFHMVALDAVTGELLWKTHLFSGMMFPVLRASDPMDLGLGAAPPTLEDGTVTFTADMGVMSCLDLRDGHIRWLQAYPRAAEYGPDFWAGRFIFNRPNTPAIVRGGVVMVAPRDYRGILFFDLATGKIVRTYESIEFRALFGADDEFAYAIQGGDIVAVRIRDAKPAWKKRVPASRVIGAPALSGRGIVCGTDEGLFVFSPKDGSVLESRLGRGYEKIGNPLDLVDRIVAASSIAVYVYAPEATGGENWSTPRSPGPGELIEEVPAAAGMARWVLPAPEHADFYFSSRTPDVVALRSWESFQFRRLKPAPSLQWEYAGPSWPRSVQFDENVVLFDYTGGNLIAIDVGTGRVRWEIEDDTMEGARGAAGAIPAGDTVIWFNGGRIQALRAADGTVAWTADFSRMTVHGIHPCAEGLGFFLEQGAEPVALLLDRATGKEIRRVGLLPADVTVSPPVVVACARNAGHDLAALPVALVDEQYLARVDFSGGEAEFRKLEKRQVVSALELRGDTLCLVDRDSLAGARTWPGLEPLSVLQVAPSCAGGGKQFYPKGERIVARNLADGKQLWESQLYTWKTTHLSLSGETVLAVQLKEGEAFRARFRVVALDAATGNQVGETPGLGGKPVKIGNHDGDLVVSDQGYLYRFGAPRATAPGPVRITQHRADPAAITAVKIARDMAAGELEPPAMRSFTPVLDGDVSEWKGAAWAALGWPEGWQPDHVLLSANRSRRPSAAGDISARVALAQDERAVYLAVRVRDDVHDASAARPLWRGDSVEVTWRAGTEPESPSYTVTAAVVDQVPCVQVGEVSRPVRAVPDTKYWPEWLQSAIREGEVPWLRRWMDGAERVPGIRLSARRDEAASETIYELFVSKKLLPSGPFGEAFLLWDLSVHDADGSGREGALAMGTAFLQMEHRTGYMRWPDQTGREDSSGPK